MTRPPVTGELLRFFHKRFSPSIFLLIVTLLFFPLNHPLEYILIVLLRSISTEGLVKIVYIDPCYRCVSNFSRETEMAS